MSRMNYRFNQKTLRFEKIERKPLTYFIKNLLPQFLLSVALGIFIFLGVSGYIDSPAEKHLKEKNKQLVFKYNILNQELNTTADFLAGLEERDDDVYRMIFRLDPVPTAKRQAGYGGSDRYKHLNKFAHSDLMVSTSAKLDILSKKMLVQSESFKEISEYVDKKQDMAASIPAIQPISIKDLTRFGSAFGMRFHPILNRYRMHKGVDLTAPKGTQIYAAGDGMVVESRNAANGFGKVVKINHGYGYLTVYAHCSKLLVREGQKVKRGEVIALVGSTGLSTSPHLHYEVRINGKAVNPLNFYYDDLSEEEYERMIADSAGAETHVFE